MPEVVSVCLPVFVFACRTPFVHVVAFVLLCEDTFEFEVGFVCVAALLISVVLQFLTELYQKA